MRAWFSQKMTNHFHEKMICGFLCDNETIGGQNGQSGAEIYFRQFDFYGME